ncbi:MAG: hypothetical protein JNN27_03540 [Planctomycetes bacterium]|nr:hypothetical protein [Planctomycetota bacterium]
MIGSKWTKDLSSDVDFFSVNVGYDRNSNVTQQDDLIYGGLDAKYTNDGLNRLTRAHEGTLSSGSITSPTRDQQWTLSQTGNWNRDKVDLNGDGDYLDADELDDTRTHNAVNELTARDTNTSSPAEFSFTYDAAGNMTDDGVYKYEWDAFYRLRKVRNQSNVLVSEYWYNGLGFLVIRHQDTDGSGAVDGSDKKYHTYYDERWRQIATFRESDTLPKEQFVYHCAGNGGWGGSSYIDSTLLRDKDQSTAWTAQADRTETRAYYCQNWRADVVVIVDHAAAIQESVRYSAYGVPIGLPMGDADADGDCDAGDLALVSGWIGTPTYNVRGDFNLDGVLDAKDETIATDNGGAVHGRGVLSDLDFGNRKGYAGYEADAKLLGSKWHVRHRVLDSVLGRWLRRDPLGYVDGVNFSAYVSGRSPAFGDAGGLQATPFQGTTLHSNNPPPPSREKGWAPDPDNPGRGGWSDSDYNCGGHAVGVNKEMTGVEALWHLEWRGCGRMASCDDHCECGVRCWFIVVVQVDQDARNGSFGKPYGNWHVFCGNTGRFGDVSSCSTKNASGPVQKTTPSKELKNWGGSSDGSTERTETRRDESTGQAYEVKIWAWRTKDLLCFCCP